PSASINFVTCHDGFTLNDLVSYNEKHNLANGEANRDGVDDNMGWNCGAEGETNDAKVDRLRARQVKNFAAILMLSQGVPMMLAGDELRRTQQGNNNAYCQDNEISWLDWSLLERNRETFEFFRFMIDLRKRHRSLQRRSFFDGSVNERGVKDIDWHGCSLNKPGWDDPNGRALAFTLAGVEGEEDIHVMMNMYWEPLSFELPVVKGRKWFRAADTSLAHPNDISLPGKEAVIGQESYMVGARSVVILIGRAAP
ncbi:MAG: glycogen debranching enzyme, partial [Planctomycetota bacterium]|nr:glycogen debranching enzyme [Planctomycetota bacterium]